MGRGFSISAGQQMVWITLGEKWQLLVRVKGSQSLLRATAIKL
jgi:hypothetical protein